MQTQIKKLAGLIWVNVIGNDYTELRKVLTENSMNESLVEEISDPILSARMDNLRNAIYLTFYFPEQADFIIKSNMIISSSKKEIPEIKNFVENLDKIVVVNRYNPHMHGGAYFAYFLKLYFQNCSKQVDKINDSLTDIEENILHADQRISLDELIKQNAKISDMMGTLRMQKHVLDAFKDAGIKTFGIEFGILGDMVLESYRNVINALDRENGKLRNLKETLSMIIATKNNKTIKVFTVVCIIALPLIFLASFFGMSTTYPQDLATSQFGTVYVMGTMLFFSLMMLSYLHYKKII